MCLSVVIQAIDTTDVSAYQCHNTWLWVKSGWRPLMMTSTGQWWRRKLTPSSSCYCWRAFTTHQQRELLPAGLSPAACGGCVRTVNGVQLGADAGEATPRWVANEPRRRPRPVPCPVTPVPLSLLVSLPVLPSCRRRRISIFIFIGSWRNVDVNEVKLAAYSGLHLSSCLGIVFLFPPPLSSPLSLPSSCSSVSPP